MARHVTGLCGLAALAACVATLSAQASRKDEATVRRQAAALVAEWRQGPRKDPDKLTADLVFLGKLASPYLCELLDRREPDLPVEALVVAVGLLRVPGALDTVVRLMPAATTSVRLAAVDALDCLGLPECLPHLVKAVDDEQQEVASRAQAALLSERSDAPRMVVAVSARLRVAKEKWRLTQVLARSTAAEAHETLIELLRSIDEDENVAALQALRVLARGEDGGAVLELLRRTSLPGVKKEACLFLGKVRCHKATEPLIGLLSEPDPGVVASSHWALREITGQDLKPDPELWKEWWSRSGKAR